MNEKKNDSPKGFINNSDTIIAIKQTIIQKILLLLILFK